MSRALLQARFRLRSPNTGLPALGKSAGHFSVQRAKCYSFHPAEKPHTLRRWLPEPVPTPASQPGPDSKLAGLITISAARLRVDSFTFLLLFCCVALTAAPGALAAASPLADVAFSFDSIAAAGKALIEQYANTPFVVPIFIGLYALAAVLLVPAPILTLAAGATFGILKGTALVSAASTVGASLSFLIARFAARPYVASRLQGSARFQRVDRGIASDGARVVFLLRLSPLVPYGLLNYMLGLTQIPFPQFVLASWTGMLPGTFAYVSLGSAGKAGFEGGADPVKLLLYGLGAVASVLAVALVGRIANSALEEGQSKQGGQDSDGVSQ